MSHHQIKPTRLIEKVPRQLLKEEKNREHYFPKVVSIGPYHHGKPELRLVEAFKPKALELFVSGGRENKELYLKKVFTEEKIGEIRKCYEQDSTDMYTDQQLAEMMLLDACFIIIYIEINISSTKSTFSAKFVTVFQNLGRSAMPKVIRDLLLLENQIPIRIVKDLIYLRYERDEAQELVNRYLNFVIYGEYEWKKSYRSEEPFHLVEAFHKLVVSGNCVDQSDKILCPSLKCRWLCCCFRVNKMIMSEIDTRKYLYSLCSVTELKAKGIYVKPSSIKSLKQIKLKQKFIHGQLQLPSWSVTIFTKVFFLNLIGYEMNTNNPSLGEVTSYIHFMKSLIESPQDVEELRENNILYNMLGTDEQILNVYKDINTYLDNAIIHKSTTK